MSPTIFNVSVNAFIRHRVTVVMPSEAGTGGLGIMTNHLAEYFYANDNIVALTQRERLYRQFEILKGLINQVILRTNTAKTVGMVCQP